MKCEVCKKGVRDKFSFPWIHRECARGNFWQRKRADPERLITEYGVKVLEKTIEGRAVLNNARKKYRAELVQQGDPEFDKLYGKQIKERAEARRELQQQSEKLWEEKGGRSKSYAN